MTAVVGLRFGGKVYMGADSLGVGGYRKTVRNDPKVFCREGCILGCCGSPRMKNLLQYELIVPPYDGNDPYRYMVISFVQAVQTCFTEGKFGKNKSGREKGGNFLVGLPGGHLYYVESHYSIGNPQNDYFAIGSGDELVCGAMFATQGMDMSPQVRIELALRAAEHHNTCVAGPFVIESI